jgi:DNA polymerase-3 subunit alpha (Gram-positive type)
MSAFDGISAPHEVLECAKSFNAPAVAVADRCNVQAYPELAKYSSELQQKIIYGVELDVMDNVIPLVLNADDNTKINSSEYIVFDIETTGLYNEFEELIEFAGYKIRNNTLVDQLDFFIKPSKEIPAHITKLTHITNEMLINAEPLKSSLKKIIE